MSPTAKILISRGFGAGWSTWNYGAMGEYVLTYQPLIDYLERGGKARELVEEHPLIVQLKAECKARFDDDVCVLGATEGLEVFETSGPYRVCEYDGSEYVEQRDKIAWRED